MHPFHRSGEINFYEELGVASDATPEEIRDAFRSLARLLHPDQQTDLQLKEIAERQMRKLNPIYAVLSDPERRRRYDEDLLDGYPGPIIIDGGPPRNLHRIAGRLVWGTAILVIGGLLYWLSSDTTPGPQSHTRIENLIDSAPASNSSSGSADPGQEIARLRASLRTAMAQRDQALSELSAQRGRPASDSASSSTPHQDDRTAPMMAMTELPSPPRLPAAAPAPLRTDIPAVGTSKPEPSRSDSPSPNRRLAGFWFYAKPAQGQRNKDQSLYPPEYIEAVITEENGVVHGKYRSRFRIVDRAISPEVNFSFSGAPNGSVVTCPWTGPGGAKGELTLRLVSDNSIRVDWSATDLGTQQGLISGTAVLTRRLE